MTATKPKLWKPGEKLNASTVAQLKATLKSYGVAIPSWLKVGGNPTKAQLNSELVKVYEQWQAGKGPKGKGNPLQQLGGWLDSTFQVNVPKNPLDIPGAIANKAAQVEGQAIGAGISAGISQATSGFSSLLSGFEPAIGNYVRKNVWVILIFAVAAIILLGAGLKMFDGGHMPIPVPV